MPLSDGRWAPLSLPRRFVNELLRACRGIPTATAERRMELALVVQARQLWQPRPVWPALFLKAFAQVAAETPALRCSYMAFPWAHLYEHAAPVGTVVLEGDYRGEKVVFFTHVRRPHLWPLTELDAKLRRCKEQPITGNDSFRRGLRIARLPWPLRPFLMWLGLHGSGRLRRRFFGTFGLSSTASDGATLLSLMSALTATIHYGLMDSQGRLDVRLTFDHRVLDGATAARALVALENVLRGPVLEELRQSASASAAA